MKGLTVNNIHLDRVLTPIASFLDNCWWGNVGGVGMHFPAIRPPRRLPAVKPPPRRRGPGRHSSAKAQLGPFDPDDWQRYLTESDAAWGEYERWLVCGTGKPGFFSRYSMGLDSDWKMYFVSDAPDLPIASLGEAVSRFDRIWFDSPPQGLPGDICLITRCPDSAYLDLFFRDTWQFDAVWGFLEESAMQPRNYQPYDPHASA